VIIIEYALARNARQKRGEGWYGNNRPATISENPELAGVEKFMSGLFLFYI
jgi:hypothetical protein